MNLSSNNWSLSLDLNGGRIQELSYKGIKIFGTYHRIDGKVGNTHLCIPSFDKEGQTIYGLPFHGFIRNIQWYIKNKLTSSIIISCKTPLSVLYPAKLSVEQEFNLKDSFIHTIRVTHIEGSEVPFNIGCHYYWDTPKGWEKSTLNSQDLVSKIKSNGYMDLKKDNIIVFSHGVYQMHVDSFRSAVLWTSYKINNQGDKLFSNDFCCIEPVIEWPRFFGSKESILRPGETVSASIQIKKVV